MRQVLFLSSGIQQRRKHHRKLTFCHLHRFSESTGRIVSGSAVMILWRRFTGVIWRVSRNSIAGVTCSPYKGDAGVET